MREFPLIPLCRPALLACGLLMIAVPGAPGLEVGADTIDLSDFPGSVVEDVVVPNPSEIFSVLDKLGEPDWASQVRLPNYGARAVRTEQALIFGVVVAEGFLAVQAEDWDAVEEIGRQVISLSQSLGVAEQVKSHAQAILDAAGDGDRRAVRKELDRTQQTVRETLTLQRDDDLARLVSLGGWLRGTEAATRVIVDAYTDDKAELLNQPFLVEHFQASIAAMARPVRENVHIAAIAGELGTVRELMADDGIMTSADVIRVQKICAELVEKIATP